METHRIRFALGFMEFDNELGLFGVKRAQPADDTSQTIREGEVQEPCSHKKCPTCLQQSNTPQRLTQTCTSLTSCRDDDGRGDHIADARTDALITALCQAPHC